MISGMSTTQLPTFNKIPSLTPINHRIDDLHMIIFWICMVIGVCVFSVMIYTMITCWKSTEYKANSFHSSLVVEVIWAVIPFLIVIAMAIPAIIAITRLGDDMKADITINIMVYQSKWQYQYLNQGIRYFSSISVPTAQRDNRSVTRIPLVVPIHKKIRFLIMSKDAMPGFIHEVWTRIEKPGTYRGQCSELCGIDHVSIPLVVIAKTQKDFDRWVLNQKNMAHTLKF